ncbi:MAG: helix-turn-helix domain-containing protein [Bacteroidota bacterium]
MLNPGLDQHFLFFLGLVGVFNGLVLSLYVAAAGRRRVAHLLVSGLLLLFCTRVGVSCIYFFSGTVPWSLVQLGLSAQLLTGPVLYEAVRALLREPEDGTPNLWHLGFWLGAAGIGGGLYPFAEHVLVWDHHIRFVIHAIVAVYYAGSVYLMARHYWTYKHAGWTPALKRSVVVAGAACTVAAGFAVSLYTSYIVGPVVFSGVMCAVEALYWLSARHEQPASRSIAYAEKKISANEAQPLVDQLHALLQSEALYKQPEFKLADLAAKLGMTPHRLSQLLNDNMGQSFASLVNSYRIREAQRLLVEEPLLTMEAIGYEAGFNSKSAFYAAFKRHTGQTPAASRSTLAADVLTAPES